MMVITIMTLCYAGFYLIPTFDHEIKDTGFYNLSRIETNCSFDVDSVTNNLLCQEIRGVKCSSTSDLFEGYLFRGFDNEINVCLRNDSISLELNETFVCENDIALVPDCLYKTGTFLSFVILMCIGTIGFNVTNCISDAICFDMLGKILLF